MKKLVAIFALMILGSFAAHAEIITCRNNTNSALLKVDGNALLPLQSGKVVPVLFAYELSGQVTKRNVTCKLQQGPEGFSCGQIFDGVELIGIDFGTQENTLGTVTVLSDVHSGFGHETNRFYLRCQ